jgi:hypothetical protein
MHFFGIWIRILYTYPFEVIAWGWLIVICDMRIYMLFEGRRYWPDGLRDWMIQREKARLQKLENVDYDTDPDSRIAVEAAVEYAQYPIDEKGDSSANRPTRLGNLIEPYESYPNVKYGLDSVFYWYRIWVSLDKDTREEIDNAQSVVDSAVYIVFALFMSGLVMWAYALIWLNWSPLPPYLQSPLPYLLSPPALLVLGAVFLLSAFFLYRLSLPAHAQFGELFKSLFDQHQSKLSFDDVLREIGRLRGAPYVGISNKERYQIIWRFCVGSESAMKGSEKTSKLRIGHDRDLVRVVPLIFGLARRLRPFAALAQSQKTEGTRADSGHVEA